MSTIKELAQEVLNNLVRGDRLNGESFLKLNEDAPEWQTDLIRDAHGNLLPDDFIYAFVQEALLNIVDADGDVDEARDQLEGDIYSRDLTRWLASHALRASYVDQAVNDGMVDTKEFELFTALRMGQYFEKAEVFESVVGFLENRLSEVA